MDLNPFFGFFRRSFGVFWGSTKKPPVSESTGKAHCLLTPKIWDYCLLFREETEINNPPCVHLRNLQIFSEEGSSGRSHQLSPLREGTQLCRFFFCSRRFFGGKAEEPCGARVSGRSKLRRINEFNLCLVFFLGEWVPGSIYRVSGLLQFVHHCLGTIIASIFYIFICNYDHLLPLFVVFGVNVLFVQSCIIKMLNTKMLYVES